METVHYDNASQIILQMFKKEDFMLTDEYSAKLLEFLTNVCNYEEESTKIVPSIIFFTDISSQKQPIDNYAVIQTIYTDDIQGSQFKRKLKAIIPFCLNGWNIFVDVSTECLKYGICRIINGQSGLSLKEILLSIDSDFQQKGIVFIEAINKFQFMIETATSGTALINMSLVPKDDMNIDSEIDKFAKLLLVRFREKYNISNLINTHINGVFQDTIKRHLLDYILDCLNENMEIPTQSDFSLHLYKWFESKIKVMPSDYESSYSLQEMTLRKFKITANTVFQQIEHRYKDNSTVEDNNSFFTIDNRVLDQIKQCVKTLNVTDQIIMYLDYLVTDRISLQFTDELDHVRRSIYKLLRHTYRKIHGGICLVISSQYIDEHGIPDQLTDGIWLQEPIDFFKHLDTISICNDSDYNYEYFYTLSNLFVSMLDIDGITVIDDLGRIRGFNVFLKKTESNQKVSGGARKRAALTLLATKECGYLGVYFQSQDGEVFFKEVI